MVFQGQIGGFSFAKKHKGRRVLLVEDTRFFSIAIRECLESAFGVVVDHCSTFDALKTTLENKGEPYSLVILDYCQSDAADGEALDHILERKIPAILFTGSDNPLKSRNSTGGNVDYVAKSSSHALENLASCVDRYLSAALQQLVIVDRRGQGSPVLPLLNPAKHLFVFSGDEDDAIRTFSAFGTTDVVLVNVDDFEDGGLGLLDRLVGRHGADHVRAIGYSSARNEEAAARFLNAGGDDFLDLPMNAATFAARIDHCVRLYKRIQTLHRMASRDFLTDLLNRRYFFEKGPKIVEQCLKQSKPISMALLDIDHFKRLNDTYGHEVGDVVLKGVARKLTRLVDNKPHLAARLGGEEFGILLVGLDIEHAYEFCEMVRREIAAHSIVADDEDISVTISLGLARIGGTETFDNYLNAADQYLYLAKHSGRNRVFSDYHVEGMRTSA